MERLSRDLCPDYLTPETMITLAEVLKIYTIRDFLITDAHKIASATSLNVEQVQQIRETIYDNHHVHVLNCGELVLNLKPQNEIFIKLDLPELDAFSRVSSSLFEPGQIIEMFGCPGSGKTQFSLFLSVKSLMSGKNVVYIDTRNDFSVKRLLDMANESLTTANVSCEGFRMSLTPSISDLTSLLTFLVNLDDCFISNVGMLIIDNLSTLVLPWLQDGQLNTAVREVVRITALLRKLMYKRKMAVFIVNNATTFMDDQQRFFKPSLGKVFSNVSDTRVFIENLYKDGTEQQIFKLTLHKSISSRIGQHCHVILDKNVILPAKP